MCWGTCIYSEYGAFTGQCVYLSERLPGKVARGKVIAGLVWGPFIDRMEELVKLPSMDPGPYGRSAKRKSIMREFTNFIKQTIDEYNLPGYVGFEIRSHYLWIFFRERRGNRCLDA